MFKIISSVSRETFSNHQTLIRVQRVERIEFEAALKKFFESNNLSIGTVLQHLDQGRLFTDKTALLLKSDWSMRYFTSHTIPDKNGRKLSLPFFCAKINRRFPSNDAVYYVDPIKERPVEIQKQEIQEFKTEGSFPTQKGLEVNTFSLGLEMKSILTLIQFMTLTYSLSMVTHSKNGEETFKSMLPLLAIGAFEKAKDYLDGLSARIRSTFIDVGGSFAEGQTEKTQKQLSSMNPFLIAMISNPRAYLAHYHSLKGLQALETDLSSAKNEFKTAYGYTSHPLHGLNYYQAMIFSGEEDSAESKALKSRLEKLDMTAWYMAGLSSKLSDHRTDY